MKKSIRLKLQKTVKIKPTKPFEFDSTFHKPDHFTSGDNLWKSGIRWQTWNWKKISLGLKFINKGTVNNPSIEIKIYSKNKLTKDFINSLITNYLSKFRDSSIALTILISTLKKRPYFF